MSLIDFLKKEREERKAYRKQQKQDKKAKTPEEKRRKIYSIVFGFLITFGVIFYTVNSCSGSYSWESVVGITDEMKIALEQSVSEETIFPNGRITQTNYDSLTIKLNSAGIDFDSDEDINPHSDLILSEKEAGALVNQIFSALDETKKYEVKDFSVYTILDAIYCKSVITLNLSEAISGSTLPSVYLISTSKVQILDNTIMCMETDYQINEIDDPLNDEIIDVLNKNMTGSIISNSNEMLCSTLSLFAESCTYSIELKNHEICFVL